MIQWDSQNLLDKKIFIHFIIFFIWNHILEFRKLKAWKIRYLKAFGLKYEWTIHLDWFKIPINSVECCWMVHLFEWIMAHRRSMNHPKCLWFSLDWFGLFLANRISTDSEHLYSWLPHSIDHPSVPAASNHPEYIGYALFEV